MTDKTVSQSTQSQVLTIWRLLTEVLIKCLRKHLKRRVITFGTKICLEDFSGVKSNLTYLQYKNKKRLKKNQSKVLKFNYRRRLRPYPLTELSLNKQSTFLLETFESNFKLKSLIKRICNFILKIKSP
jgi:hypothetical protein